MPKSVEELFDGAEESPQQEAAELVSQETSPPADVAPREAEPPAPDAQEAKGKQPDAPVGKEQGAPPAPEDNDGRDPAFGRLRKERNDYREQLSAEKVEKARIEERYKALEARNKALEAAQAQQQPQPQQQIQANLPNPAHDPVGYAAALKSQLEASIRSQLQSQAIVRSMETAKKDFGDDLVGEATKWFESSVPSGSELDAKIRSNPEPVVAIVKHFKKLKAQAEIGDDPDAYKAKVEADAKAKLEADIRAQIAAESQSQPETQTARPNLPPSLGRVPNAGARGVTYTGPTPIETLWG